VSNLTYAWTFDTNVFTAVGATNLSTLVLSVNTGVDINLVVSTIGLTVTNEEGCKSTMECYYSPEGIECGITSCASPMNLTVIND